MEAGSLVKWVGSISGADLDIIMQYGIPVPDPEEIYTVEWIGIPHDIIGCRDTMLTLCEFKHKTLDDKTYYFTAEYFREIQPPMNVQELVEESIVNYV